MPCKSWGMPSMTTLSPSRSRATSASCAARESDATVLCASAYRSTGSRFMSTAPSSRRESFMMSSTSAIIRCASLYMFSANIGMSCGFTMPFCSSSAQPDMVCSGVFSSCDTLAVNSRRICSAFSFSLMSKMRSTMPLSLPSDMTGLAFTCLLPYDGGSTASACMPFCAMDTSLRISSPSHSSVIFLPVASVLRFKRRFAASFMLKTSAESDRSTMPSVMFLDAASNSRRLLLSSCSCFAILYCCARSFRSNGSSSS